MGTMISFVVSIHFLELCWIGYNEWSFGIKTIRLLLVGALGTRLGLQAIILCFMAGLKVTTSHVLFSTRVRIDQSGDKSLITTREEVWAPI